MGKLYESIEYRYRHQKPTLFTANHGLAELADVWGERNFGAQRAAQRAEVRDAGAAVLSRIAGQLWGTVELKGRDQRW